MPRQALKFWTVALAAAVFFLGCSGGDGGSEHDNKLSSSHLLGRYLPIKETTKTQDGTLDITLTQGYQMGWPGNGIAFRFEGKTALLPIEDSECHQRQQMQALYRKLRAVSQAVLNCKIFFTI